MKDGLGTRLLQGWVREGEREALAKSISKECNMAFQVPICDYSSNFYMISMELTI